METVTRRYLTISAQETQRLPHMPQLDGLRALAVFAVLVHHYIEGGWGFGANLGVKLFFVMSGFLITSILIRSRNAVALSDTGKLGALRRFYVRRFLRIFPLYYFIIFVALAINLEPVREYIGWLLTYTLNIKMAQQGWYIDHFAHFWTLAIEEQFYLFWPCIVLLVPRHWLLPSVLIMIALGPLYRLYHVVQWIVFDGQIDALRTYIFTLTCFDTLGVGALLGILSHMDFPQKHLQAFLSKWILPAGIIGGFGLLITQLFAWGWSIYLVLGDVVLALLLCWLIHKAALGFSGKIKAVLEARPLRYLGKISYGIYVYHPFMPALIAGIYAWAGWSYEGYALINMMLATMLTLGISALSWHLMERPINNLKKLYARPQTGGT